jgi:hypothetical protein
MKRELILIGIAFLIVLILFLSVTRYLSAARTDRLDKALLAAEARIAQLEAEVQAANQKLATLAQSPQPLPGPNSASSIAGAWVQYVAAGAGVTNLVRIEGTSSVHNWQVESHLLGGSALLGTGFPTAPADSTAFSLFPDMLFDAGDQVFELDRLGEVFTATDRAAGGGRLLLFHNCGQEYDGNILQRLVFPELGGDLAAIDAGHHDIQQDEIGMKRMRGGYPGGPGILSSHLVFSRALQIPLQHSGEAGLVVYYQDFLLHRGHIVSSFRAI